MHGPSGIRSKERGDNFQNFVLLKVIVPEILVQFVLFSKLFVGHERAQKVVKYIDLLFGSSSCTAYFEGKQWHKLSCDELW